MWMSSAGLPEMHSSTRTEQFSQPHFFLLLFQYTCFLEADYHPISCSTAKEGYLESVTGAAQKLVFTKHCCEWVFCMPSRKAGWCNFWWQPSIGDPVRQGARTGMAARCSHAPGTASLPTETVGSYIGIKPECQRTEPDPPCSLG